MMLAIARVTVPGMHAWRTQPPGSPRAYLNAPHRHLFHLEVGVVVSHGDRQVEILALGQQVRDIVERSYAKAPDGEVDFGDRSCEHIAEQIAGALQPFPAYVRVFEDGENGAEWRG